MTALANRSGCIVVLGMHRSGTSCVGGLLNAMGAYFGPAGMDLGANAENPKGFWERQDLNWACEFALLAQGSCWWQPLASDGRESDGTALLKRAFATIRDDLDAHAPWFIKDPRLCLLAGALQGELENALYVHVVRNPMEVVLSLQRRNGLGMAHALALWEMYTISAFAASLGRPRLLLDYSVLVTEPHRMAAQICAFLAGHGLQEMRALNETDAEKWVDPKLRRQNYGGRLDEYLTGVQLELNCAIETGAILDETQPRKLSQGAQAELQHVARTRNRLAGNAIDDYAGFDDALLALRRRLPLYDAVLSTGSAGERR